MPRRGGRQPGSKNKVTADVKLWLHKVVSDNQHTLERDLLEMTPSERWRVLTSIMQYILPKAQPEPHQTNIIQLSPEQQLAEIEDKVKVLQD